MTIVLNSIRRGLYLDSVALMRLSSTLEAMPGVRRAALMIGTPANRALLQSAGLLVQEGSAAGPNDLVIAVAAADDAAARQALARAGEDLAQRRPATRGTVEHRPRSLGGAVDVLPGASLALISVPGEFAVREARLALRRGLDVMIFSDNVPVEAERALKEEAQRRGRIVMGPDCGTAFIAGAPLGFANVVPRGPIGIAAASGTGMQEVACLITRAGSGISHGIGTGGRDVSDVIGGLSMLAAIDALDSDASTECIVLLSKPPSHVIAGRLLDRVAASTKDVVVCFLGLDALALPANARFAPTLREAAELALGRMLPLDPVPALPSQAGWIRGLFAGGTLCAEAQLLLRRAGEAVASNAPVPGAAMPGAEGHLLLDLGADEYTRGQPHPMIEPAVRTPLLEAALAEPGVGAVLLDVVLGWGAHPDPAGAVAAVIAGSGVPVVTSVCGTPGDPQNYEEQIAKLRAAGAIVAGSNAEAAELALEVVRG